MAVETYKYCQLAMSTLNVKHKDILENSINNNINSNDIDDIDDLDDLDDAETLNNKLNNKSTSNNQVNTTTTFTHSFNKLSINNAINQSNIILTNTNTTTIQTTSDDSSNDDDTHSNTDVSLHSKVDEYSTDLTNNPVTGVYDEIEIEDMLYDSTNKLYTYPCPCGDKFIISRKELIDGEDIARCPSCSLIIRVIYDNDMFDDVDDDD